MKKLLLTSFILVFSLQMMAQKGVVKGNVIDAGNAEELIGVTVVVAGTTTGAVTDVFGNYFLELDPGTYTLQYSYISYQTQTVEGVEIVSGEVNTIDILLQEDNIQLEEVVVQATAINNNDVALLKLQQKSYAVQDGISATEIARLGASNSAESMQQVTGATIEEGKFVVMRGLGDRYSITQMNGITLPSTDPYRNSSSMDLIPNTMVENIVTKKTFTPDQPGNFTGGNVNITTRPIPDEFYLEVGAQLGFNTQASFRDNFLTDRLTGDTDWAGFDDGTRELDPILADNREFFRGTNLNQIRVPVEENFTADQQLFDDGAKITNQPIFTPTTKNSGPNYRFGISFGDRFGKGQSKFGYNVGLTLKRSLEFREDRIYNLWEYPGPGGEVLRTVLDTDGPETFEQTTIGGLVGLAYKINDRNQLAFDFIYNHSGELGALNLVGIYPFAISNPHQIESSQFSWVERALTNYRLSGRHALSEKNNIQIDWDLVYNNYTQDEPSTRLFLYDQVFSSTDTTFRINRAEYPEPFYFYRELQDDQITGKIDFTIPVNKGLKVKAGGLYSTNERDFQEIRYQQLSSGADNTADYLTFGEADGDFDAFFDPNNAGIVGLQNASTYALGHYFEEASSTTNSYDGHTNILALYGMVIWEITDKWKLVGGLRAEQTDLEVNFQEVVNGRPQDQTAAIDEWDYLPSLSFIYAVNDQSNIRFGYSRTLARPNLREKAPFQAFEGTFATEVVGNADLVLSDINNIDFRYELFPKAGEIIAASAFFKQFNDPIQRVSRIVGSRFVRTWDNVDTGWLTGFELEFRKGLGAWSPALENFYFGTNFTYTYSRVDLTAEELENQQNLNPDLRDWRPFQAQAPFIWNFNISYLNFDNGIESAITFNLYGRRLTDNSIAGTPDVYEINGRGNRPHPTMNFTFNKQFGDNWTLRFKAINFLNTRYESNYEFLDEYYVGNSWRSGVDLSLAVIFRI